MIFKIETHSFFCFLPVVFVSSSPLFLKFLFKTNNFNKTYNNSIHIIKKMITPCQSQFSSFNPIQIIPVLICFNSVPLNFINFYSESTLQQQQEMNDAKNSSEQKNHILNSQQKSSFDPKHKSFLKAIQKQKSKPQEIWSVKKKKDTQQEYKPSQSNKQKKSKDKPYQSVRRNIMPNIVHQIFCFIQKKKRSESIVRKYIQKMPSEQTQCFNVDRFYLYQKLLKQKTNHYINMEGLCELNQFQEPKCEIYSKEEQKTFTKMNRILIKYFLQHQFENMALTSSRMSSEARLWNLEEKRKIMEYLTDAFKKKE